MRGLRSLVVLLIIAAGLGAYIYFVESEREPAGTEAADTVFDVEADDITHLEIAPPEGDAVSLEKAGDDWRLTAPVAVPADATAVQAVVSSLASMTISTVLDEQAPADLTPYGLAPAHMSVQFGTAGDTGGHRIDLGSKTPTGTDLYARVDGDPRLLLVASYQEDALDRSAFDLRDKRVLDVARDAVDRISIARPSAPTLTAARESDDWRLTAPVDARAQNDSVSSLVTRVIQARMSAIVSEGTEPSAADLRTWGLARPALEITFGAGSTEATLAIGGEHETGSRYARDLSRSLVFTVPESLFTDLDKQPDDLRNRDVFALTSFSARGLDVDWKGVTHAFVKQGAAGEENAAEAWTRTAPDAGEVNQTAMTDLLNTLASLRADRFVASPPASGDDMDVTARFGAAASPTEEHVTLRRRGDTVYALIPGSADAAVVPTDDFDRAVTQLEGLEPDSE